MRCRLLKGVSIGNILRQYQSDLEMLMQQIRQDGDKIKVAYGRTREARELNKRVLLSASCFHIALVGLIFIVFCHYNT